jgi:hypothetical protein
MVPLKRNNNNNKSGREENCWGFGKFCRKKYTNGASQKLTT